MTETYSFILPSGVECEVSEITGTHQRIMTEQRKRKLGENLNEMLFDILVRVGSLKKPDLTLEFVSNELLEKDRKYALLMARQFSMGFPNSFSLNYPYKDANGKDQIYEHVEDLPLVNNVHTFEFKPYPFQVKEYSDIQKYTLVTLPRSKQEVRFSLLDGKAMLRAAMTKKEEMSSHTPMYAHNPVYFHQGATEKVPVRLDLDKLSLVDIEFLRKAMKESEAEVYADIKFENPSSDVLFGRDKNVVIDVTTELAFFFPSQAL